MTLRKKRMKKGSGEEEDWDLRNEEEEDWDLGSGESEKYKRNME